jgi:hypothetical protein
MCVLEDVAGSAGDATESDDRGTGLCWPVVCRQSMSSSHLQEPGEHAHVARHVICNHCFQIFRHIFNDTHWKLVPWPGSGRLSIDEAVALYSISFSKMGEFCKCDDCQIHSHLFLTSNHSLRLFLSHLAFSNVLGKYCMLHVWVFTFHLGLSHLTHG